MILDNHNSHLSLEGLEFAKQNGIIMVSFPPHCSHKLQPLDLSVFGPLKKRTASAQQNWLRNHPGQSMTMYDLPGVVGEAWTDSLVGRNITAGFQKAGIFPFNRQVFSDGDYAPSSVTDRPDPSSTAPTSSEGLPDSAMNSEPCETAPQPDVQCVGPSDLECPNSTSISDTGCPNPTSSPHVPTPASVPNVPASTSTYVSSDSEQLPGRVANVRGDGHCIIHAARLCLEHAGKPMSYDQMCDALISEIVFNRDTYTEFATEGQDIVADACKFIFQKDYNTDTCDIVLSALSNACETNVVIFQHQENSHRYARIQLTPDISRKDTQAKFTIYMMRTGDGLGAHYSAVLPPSSENAQDSIPTRSPSPQVFSPVCVQPHPKAGLRAQAARGRRKRTTEILTDTPVKKALEEEKKQKQNRKDQKGTAATKKGHTKAAKKARKQIAYDSEVEEDDDCACIVCLSKFSASKQGEKWIQCCDCKRWSHEECVDIGKNPIYICHNCDSDDDSIYSRL